AAARRRSKADGAASRAADAYARARVAGGDDDASLVVAETEARLDAGEEASAVAACSEFLKRRTDGVAGGPADAVLALRAEAYRRLSMWPSAAADLARLREARPDDEGVLARLVDSLYRANDADGARRVAAAAAPRASPAAAHVLEFLAALHGGDV